MKIALIAHDKKKHELVQFAQAHADLLGGYELIATGNTGRTVAATTSLEVECVAHGPHGGDAIIASQVVEKKVVAVFFLIDPTTPQPHEPDISTLQRLCNIHNVLLATNLATAEAVILRLAQAQS